MKPTLKTLKTLLYLSSFIQNNVFKIHEVVVLFAVYSCLFPVIPLYECTTMCSSQNAFEENLSVASYRCKNINMLNE